jgi:hypothetical protein
VSNASLIHYDLLLNNIIVNYNLKKKHWEISAIIDNEWVSTVDSDIDLIQLENCIYFNQHRDTFKRYWKFFEKAYMRHGIISKDIAEKRVIYHMTRSLFYLMEVYRKDREKVVYPTNSTIRNIKNNYKFLQRLVSKGEIDFSLFS